MNQRESKQSHRDVPDQMAPMLNRTDFSAESISKLRRLVSELMAEVDSLDERPLDTTDRENFEGIDFYEATRRFEIALIRRALRQTNGHQVLAASLLNLNPTTLHTKIKQYGLKS